MLFVCDVIMIIVKYFGKWEILIGKNVYYFVISFCYFWFILVKSIKENGRGIGSEY